MTIVLGGCSQIREEPKGARIDDFITTQVFYLGDRALVLYSNWTEHVCPGEPATHYYTRNLRDPGFMGASPPSAPTGSTATLYFHDDADGSYIGGGCTRTDSPIQPTRTLDVTHGHQPLKRTDYTTGDGYAVNWYSQETRLAFEFRCTASVQACTAADEEVRTGLAKFGRSVYCWEVPASLETEIKGGLSSGSRVSSMRLVRPGYAAVYVAVKFDDESVGVFERGADGRIREFAERSHRTTTFERYPRALDKGLEIQIARVKRCLGPDADPLMTFHSEEDIS